MIIVIVMIVKEDTLNNMRKARRAASMAERRWIRVNETAEILGLHPMSVRKMIARGEIPAVRIGRMIRVDLRALEERLEAQVRGQVTGWGQK
jgi:excisionase family DNA binding protein